MNAILAIIGTLSVLGSFVAGRASNRIAEPTMFGFGLLFAIYGFGLLNPVSMLAPVFLTFAFWGSKISVLMLVIGLFFLAGVFY
jgi:hypothetical protein